MVTAPELGVTVFTGRGVVTVPANMLIIRVVEAVVKDGSGDAKK
jgi:hypothetical protein